jgi:hypothetical protein
MNYKLKVRKKNNMNPEICYCDYCDIEYDPTDYDDCNAMCWIEKGDCGCCGCKLDQGNCHHDRNDDNDDD